jgi:hypothetical protein
MILDSDSVEFGGLGRLTQDQEHFTTADSVPGRHHLILYLPNRTGIVLRAVA